MYLYVTKFFHKQHYYSYRPIIIIIMIIMLTMILCYGFVIKYNIISYHIIYNSYKCTGTHKAHKCTNSGPKTQRNISA